LLLKQDRLIKPFPAEFVGNGYRTASQVPERHPGVPGKSKIKQTKSDARRPWNLLGMEEIDSFLWLLSLVLLPFRSHDLHEQLFVLYGHPGCQSLHSILEVGVYHHLLQGIDQRGTSGMKDV